MSSLSNVVVSLSDPSKWKEFHPKTEMIVTRKRGRVIFPHLDYIVKGLDTHSLYTISVHLERVDENKYKFEQNEWKFAAKGDPILPIQRYDHPHGARSGEHWMKEPVSFATLKITNDPATKDSKLIIVQSMHKYQPVVTIKKVGEAQGDEKKEFILTITEFMVVTCYQSEEVNDLKKKYNKFASGFRSDGKRARSSPEDKTSPVAKRTSPSSSSDSSLSASSSGSLSPDAFALQHHQIPMNGGYQMNPLAPTAQMNFNSFDAFNGMNDWNPMYFGMNSATWNWNAQAQMPMNQWNQWNAQPTVQNPTDHTHFTNL